MNDALVYEFSDGLATISLSKPDRGNPIDLALTQQLGAAVHSARQDDARVVLLRSTGPSFCFGGDIEAFAAAPDPPRAVNDIASTLHRALLDLVALDAVVVSAVQGVAAGAGIALAAAADIVLAAESARFVLAYTRIGYTPDGGTSLLTASLGLHRVLHLALLNPTLSAHDMQAAGLVTSVCADDELPAAADEVTTTLLRGSRTAQVAAKRLIRAHALPAPEVALRREETAITEAAGSPDGRAGIAAFLAKTPTVFPSTVD